MPIAKLPVIAAAAVAGAAVLIACVGLVHELVTAPDPHMLIHSLGQWVVTVGFHAALILLAATGINYLYRKS